MKKYNVILLIALMLISQSFCSTFAQKSKADDAKMDWWKEARFGMFIHWGLYSIPAGEWKGQKTPHYAEWLLNDLKAPVAEYKALAAKFNPIRFNAEEFVLLAQEAGMKYIVLTAKHHEGFAMFKSSDPFNIVDATPYKKDVVKALADACQKYGMRFGLYYSQAQDWTHPGGGMYSEHWDKAQEGSFDKYLEEVAVPQVKEILSAYNPSIIWWDTPAEMTNERAAMFTPILAKYPKLITNNRMGGGIEGDLETPEQYIPPTGIPGKNWESCMTINDTWGFDANDHNWKSTETLITNLIDIASKGGNYLLNVGPTPEGLIPQASIERLKEMGIWMKVNGEAIYGTSPSPFNNLEWGRATQKKAGKTTKLYLHVFNWPANGQLIVPSLGNKVVKAYALASPKTRLKVETLESDKVIDVRKVNPDKVATVIVLEIKGKPVVYEAPSILSEYTIYTNAIELNIDTKVKGGDTYYTTDGSVPTTKSSLAKGPITFNGQGDVCIKARTFKEGLAVTATASKILKQTMPKPAAFEGKQGLNYKYYEGQFEHTADFLNLTPLKTGKVESFDLTVSTSKERYALVFDGYISIPETNIYAFYLTSDDGSKLIIDDEVLDNDGPHNLIEKRMDVALSAGLHKISLQYFQGLGEYGLKVEFKSDKMSRRDVGKDYLTF